MKKVILGFLLVGGLIFVLGSLVKQAEKKQAAGKPTPAESQTVVAELKDRPFVSLTPRGDGRELTLAISNIKNAEKVEYELVYLSNDISRGVVGSFDLKGETSMERKLLLGSCSKNVCKYDENVSEGTLTLRLRGTGATQKYISDFVLQKGGSEIAAKDGQFSFKGKLSSGQYYLALSTVGLPQAVEGEVAAGPFGIFFSGTNTLKGGVSLEGEGKLSYWTGQAWQEGVGDSTPISQAYILIK